MWNLFRGLIAVFSLSLILGYSWYRHSQQESAFSSSKTSMEPDTNDFQPKGFQKVDVDTERPTFMPSSKSGMVRPRTRKLFFTNSPQQSAEAAPTTSTLKDAEFLVLVRYESPNRFRQYYPPALVEWNNNRGGYSFPAAEESAPKARKSKYFTSSKSGYGIVAVQDIRELFGIVPFETPLANFSEPSPFSTTFEIPTLDELIEMQSTLRTDWETTEILSSQFLIHDFSGGWSEFEKLGFKVPF